MIATRRAAAGALALGLASLLWAAAPRPAHAADGKLLQPVRAIDLTEGAARWGIVLGDRIILQPNDHELVAIDVQTGLVRWKYAAPEHPIRKVVRRGAQAFVLAQDLQLVDLDHGSVEWTYPLGCRGDGTCQLTPIRLDDRGLVLAGFGAAPDSLMVVDLEARDQRWPSWVRVGPVGRIDADGELIVVASRDGTEVSAVDPSMGRLLWKAALPTGGGVGGQPPLRMWAGESAVYVWRALPMGRGSSRIDVLARATGAPQRQLRSVTCSAALEHCGIEPGEKSAVAWDAPRADEGGVGSLMVHDLAAGTTPVDAQSYFIGPPVTTLGRLAVFGDRRRGRTHLEARRLPDGVLAWERTLSATGAPAGSAPRVQLRTGGAEVFVVWPELGDVTGLSLGDGTTVTYGLVDLGGQALQRLFIDGDAVVASTAQRLVALRAQPIAELVAELRRALGDGDAETARRLDGLVVPLARQFQEAAAAHAVMVRFALLQATQAARTGRGPEALEVARALLAQTPRGRAAPVVEFASELNNLLADVLLNEPGGFPATQVDVLGRAADTFGAHVESLGKSLEGAGEDAPARILAASLAVVETLARADQPGPAVRLLGALQRSPLRLDASTLPATARGAVAHEAAALARQAAAQARARDLDGAVARLSDAITLPYVDTVIPSHDPHRLQIEVLRDGAEPRHQREITSLAKEAAAAWVSLGDLGAAGGVDCFEACQRRRTTCVRPCVEPTACDAALRACADSCEGGRQPLWRAPDTVPARTDPSFPAKCL